MPADRETTQAEDAADRRVEGAGPAQSGGTSSPAGLLRLQRLAGNRAVTRSITTPVQRKKGDTKATPVKILNAGINAENAKGASNQLGHAMNVWVDVDLGNNPVAPAGAPPNTVYGLEMEYWEHVNVPRDNQGAIGEKPWNDIYAMKPEASTFNTPAAGAAVTWSDAVAQAGTRQLKGKKRIGFKDIPGLYERPGRNVSRTLDFRILFDDGTDRRKEHFASQILEITNGTLSRSAYRDSAGNNLASDGFAGGEAIGQKSNNTLGADQVPKGQDVSDAVPDEARDALDAFLAEATGRDAAPFVDRELAQFVASVDKDKQSGGSDAWLNTLAQGARGDVTGGVAAGQFLIPKMAGTKAVQKRLPSGALLVALVSANRVRRVYYTSNATRSVEMKNLPHLADKKGTINLRSFTELPLDRVVAPLPPRMVEVVDDAHATFLRRFDGEGRNQIVRLNSKVGKRIKPKESVSVIQPEQRDVTGEWVKAEYAGTTGFIRAAKLAGRSMKTDVWRAEQEKTEAVATGAGAMQAYFEEQFRDQGGGFAVYHQLIETYGGLSAGVQEAYKKIHGEAGLRKMQLSEETHGSAAHGSLTYITQFAAAQSDPMGSAVEFVAGYVKARPGQGDTLESTYNQHIPPLGLPVPATLGELMHRHFMEAFRGKDGDGHKVYTGLEQDFPDFAYRLRPAYRLVHGEDKLQQVLRDREQAEAAKDPKSSLANLADYMGFRQHGPFTLTDFAAGDGGKFDAAFDPMTGILDLTVRVAYKFRDQGEQPSATVQDDVQGGLGDQFTRSTWTQQEQTDWKDKYRTTATAPFNNSGHTIRCQRPGWEQFPAVRPRFNVVEVAEGQQHFRVSPVKNVVGDKGGGKKLMGGTSGVTASLGEANLNQWDVYDKLQDPELHGYLHDAERTQHIETAFDLDNRRLTDLLARLGTVPDGGGRAVAVRNLADGLKRLEIPSSMANLHPIVLDGGSADHVITELTNAGVRNPMESVNAGPPGPVSVTAKAPDPSLRQSYVDSWSRFTAAHEFGHMVGLVDEYYQASSPETVKAMISAGLLPPDTRGDHLRLDASDTAKDHAKEEAGQRKAQDLIGRAGLESPDFALDAPGGGMPKTTSLMTGGFDVTKVHMTTAWQALTEMTKPYVDEKYWRFV